MSTPHSPHVSHRRNVRKPPLAMFGLGVLLLAYSTAAAPPSILTGPASDMLASSIVSMSAGVSPNPDNALAAQFAQKEKELEAREALLQKEREAQSTPTRDPLPMYTFALSIVLFVLVLLNYYRDWRREHRGTFSVVTR